VIGSPYPITKTGAILPASHLPDPAPALTPAAPPRVSGERNTNLRSAPPSHTATADGCVVKHKIECTGNSEGTFHLEAGTQVRQVEDRTIDRRPAALKVTRALLRARRRRRASFRRSCFGLSIVRSSGHMRPRALPVAVIAAACVRSKTRRFRREPTVHAAVFAGFFLIPPPYFLLRLSG
jgi:hypothetical protein